MANTSFDEQIRDRIQAFTEELTELVRQSAVESLRQALGAEEGAGTSRRRGRRSSTAVTSTRAAGPGRSKARTKTRSTARSRARI